ncbi:hypothetical protein BJX70DRAFT_404396 [Aspergillus crustosus]
MDRTYYLWQNACETADLFKGAHQLCRVVFFLRREFFAEPSVDLPDLGGFDYQFFMRPFYHLRQTAFMIEVQPRLCTSGNGFDWNAINRTFDTELGSAACERITSMEPASEQQLHRALARDWYNVCLNAGSPGNGWGLSASTLRPVHAAILAGMDKQETER